MTRQKLIYDTRQLPVVLTVERAAQLLDVTPACVRKMLREGELKGFKAGKGWRILKADAMAFIGAEEVTG